VLGSIYLQAVIAATMEEVELFLAPLTARSKVREVLRGLVATRQVHTVSMGHAPHFYVAGTLPEFSSPATIYASASIPASAYFLRTQEHDEAQPEPAAKARPAAIPPAKPTESRAPRTAETRKPAAGARPHFSRPSRRSGTDSRATGTRSAPAARWSPKAAASGKAKHNGAHSAATPAKANGNGHNGNGHNGNGKLRSLSAKSTAKPVASTRNGSAPRKDARTSARLAGSRKPALTAGAKTASKRFGYAARPKQATKKRG
jgi:hypothetical protein